MSPDDERQRRMYDDFMPAVQLLIEEKLRETRHELRGEIAAIAAAQTVASAQSSREHADVRADLAAVRRDLSDLPKRVQDLERHDLTVDSRAQGVAEIKKLIRGSAVILIGAVGVINGIIALLLH